MTESNRPPPNPEEDPVRESPERDLIADAMRDAGSDAHSKRAAAESPSGSAGADDAAPPLRIPGYEIVREIRRGAQGVVYQAIQRTTRRKVALKVLRDGALATPGELARFDREIQILGQIDHPSIVAIQDSGVSEGRHWFVMDYVSGPSLDDWAMQSRRSVTETLRMTAKICDAVHAAHLRGIIHRDLKPGNIRIDATGEPRILDFGLAKGVNDLSGGEGDHRRPVTVTGQFIGSLPWASPEQAEGNPARIDLRSDVYSLGVILYQLLTGAFPYEVVGHFRDVLDNIMRAEPARPSTVGRGVNDEIETIVLKALNKEPPRRYQSAHELARDIDRYLAGEPIEAKRASGLYVLRKTLRLYRVPVTVVTLFVGVLIGFGALLWRSERQSDHRANAAVAASERADRAFAARDAAVSFVIADMLGAVDPRDGDGRAVRVVEALDAASDAVSDRFGTEPAVEAEVRQIIGAAYHALGLYVPAEAQRRATLSLRRGSAALADRAPLADALQELAETLIRLGRADEALSLAVESTALRTARDGDGAVTTALARSTVASAAFAMGDYAAAERLDREALAALREALPADDLRAVRLLHQLGVRIRAQGRPEEAEPLLREAYDAFVRQRGETALETLVAGGNLATCLLHLGRAAESIPLLRLSVAQRRERLGPDDPRLAAALQRMAEALHYSLGDSQAALEPVREAAEIRGRRLGADHLHTANSLHLLGVVLIETDRADEAQTHLAEALRIRLGRLPPSDRQVAESRSALGHALARQGRLEEALPLLRTGAEDLRSALGTADHAVRRAAARLAEALERAGSNTEAAAWRRHSEP